MIKEFVRIDCCLSIIRDGAVVHTTGHRRQSVLVVCKAPRTEVLRSSPGAFLNQPTPYRPGLGLFLARAQR